MKVMFVSQCTKKAIDETRRIIDQFAERKGDNVWQTSITEQGLETVKRLLKATARRNTAVACHLFRGRLQTELLWVVGNARKFNREGTVPTNITSKDILRANDENDWSTEEAIAILSSIAGLFHDFGKANALFQKKLKPNKGKKFEPFRHEWISLLLFRAFVGGSSDREWIERLSRVSIEDETKMLQGFPKREDRKVNPFKGLSPIAKFIGWLIVSHHRIPAVRQDSHAPQLDNINDWMDGKRFSALWNSYNCEDKWEVEDLELVGVFKLGTPLRSLSWCSSARKAGKRALKYYHLLDRDWFLDRFTMHLTRAVLMMSDHAYSNGIAHEAYQDPSYNAYANTINGILKQKLDEHNIGVAKNAFLIAKSLPKLQETLPCIIQHKGFKKRSQDNRFLWQDKAYDLACGLKDSSHDRGFFGVNMASTGCGKTLANARIMYGLSDEKLGCRFSIALGLRVLTLQTGDALREKLSLSSDDVAVMIGSKAFQELHELNNNPEIEKNEDPSSESSKDFFAKEDYLDFEGCSNDGLSRWFKPDSKLQKMLNAPILVSTIDHLISATEGCRGGKQMPPILRLLTADLVLDEPDDFDVADLHALCRLVNFAGVFGSRVLLSSATLPPTIIKALFDAYSSGRAIFNKACRRPGVGSAVCCAWFDEFGVSYGEHENVESYMSCHYEFLNTRIANLKQQPVLRRASLASVDFKDSNNRNVHQAIAESIRSSLYELHEGHHQIHSESGKHISIGLVRMANINPMVEVVKSLLSEPAKSDYCIHFCIYHSRFPLLVRSKIEEVLDRTLTRHKPDKIWQMPEIVKSLFGKSETNHIFVVFSTPVAEVGRDHDYDWAIVEPSSMRSIIQIAGRVQRHRRCSPSYPNLVILQKNLKGLRGDDIVFSKPGFESNHYQLAKKDLKAILQPEQFEEITSIPRLQVSKNMDHKTNLVDLEHIRLEAELFGDGKTALHSSLWWKKNADWCGEIQRLTRFRKPDGVYKEYILYLEEEGEDPKLHEWPEGGHLACVDRLFHKADPLKLPQGVYPWFYCDPGNEIIKISERVNMDVKETSLKFARLSLQELKVGERWVNDPIFGFYQN